MPITGGRATVLAPAPVSRGGSWGHDGWIVFFHQWSRGLERVPASGGEPDRLTKLNSDEGELSHRFPQHLPGGKAILFTVRTGGSWSDALIVAQRLDTSERKVLIEGGSDARYVPTGHLVYVQLGALMAAPFPFFSPDGDWVGFFTARELKKVSRLGGASVTICDVAPVTRGASWGPDDTIFFVPGTGSGIWKVSAGGGTPEVVTRLAPGEFSHRWPQVLPDGKAVLFATQTAGSSSFEEAQITVHSLVTGERKVLVEGGTHPRFVQSGHLVWAYSGQLFAAPFDPSRLETTGPPFHSSTESCRTQKVPRSSRSPPTDRSSWCRAGCSREAAHSRG